MVWTWGRGTAQAVESPNGREWGLSDIIDSVSTDDGARAPYPVIAPRGDLDGDTLGPLTVELEAATAQHPVVIMDASGITFSDSSFLRLVMLTHQRTDLRIAATSPVVARLFQLISVDTILHLYRTVADAQSGAHRLEEPA